MQIKSLLLPVLLAVNAVKGAVNEPCEGAGGAAGLLPLPPPNHHLFSRCTEEPELASWLTYITFHPGVCISTTDCSSGGGTTTSGGCPKDPDNIKCCSKPKCGSSTSGNCRWVSDCTSSSVPDVCPGPAGFKCCQSTASGFGGYSAPAFPTVGACKQVAVDGAKKIVAAFPGRVRQIYCTRDCVCGSGSDHCCGKATDMMCSDAGGVATLSGRTLAEWVMNNRASLNLKYVIWGQRIWNPSQDSVGPWTSWRGMDDRGDITQNHWDHVHVSYN